MNDKNNKKSKNFRKEAIYVIFFICLCVVATVAAINFRNGKIAKKQAIERQKIEAKNKQNEKQKNIALIDDSAKREKEYENSLEVKNNKNKQIAKQNETAKVSNNVSNKKMIRPVVGSLARAYSEVPVYWNSTSSYSPNFGMDIKAKAGEKVVASANGVVVKVGDNKDGFGKEVVIDHKNGLKTVYANLSNKVCVKKNQNVKQGQKIGEVGNTTLKSFNEKYGTNLHFEILKDNQSVNPEKYVRY